MKVFVAGATGVVGRRAVVRMVAAGFEVSGVARSPQQRAGLVAAGVRPIEVDLFDHDAVVAALAGHEAVVNLATAIPTGEPASDTTAWATNHRIRREASHNLVDGAIAAGAVRYVQESIALLYADGGDRVLDESWPVAPTNITDSALEAETEAERFAAHGRAGVALRFGQFYGFDSVHSVHAMEAVRAGRPAELGPPSAYRSSITTDDAASAIVAALDVASGVYSVIDDLPLSRARLCRRARRCPRRAGTGGVVPRRRTGTRVLDAVAVAAGLERAVHGRQRLAPRLPERLRRLASRRRRMARESGRPSGVTRHA